MLRTSSAGAFFALMALTVTGCESTTEPAQLEGFYYATAVNGGSLPARRIEWFSNSAGSCERDLDGADLSFSGQTQFDLFLHYTLRCNGLPPDRSSRHIGGAYSRDGSDLTMYPTTATNETIVDAELRGRSVIIVVRRNDTDFELRFLPGQ
jgi:hypothetical protein